MLKQLSVILLAAVSALAFSCSNQGEEESIIQFEVIHGGAYASVSEKKQVMVTNNDDYQKLMSEVYANLDQMPRIPEVDFTKNDVVAVFMGAKNTGGYSINVDKVIKRTDAVTVSVYETSPGSKCILTQSVTQPYEIVKVPKLNQKVKFLFKQRTKDCP
jgi:hypothetical protein